MLIKYAHVLIYICVGEGSWHFSATVEPLYSGHHWDHSKCPDFRGFLISGVDFIHMCMYLWQNQVSRFEGCPDLRVSGVRGFTVFHYKVTFIST